MSFEHPSREFVREFADSLPAVYRKTYSDKTITAHARVAQERGARPAHIGLFPSKRNGSALCIAALDRPGLLATISAALVMSGYDVMDADAYTRKTPAGISEAVDLFWVRFANPNRRQDAVSDADCLALTETLIGLLEGSIDVASAPPSVSPAGTETLVRFVEDEEGALGRLEVETGDRSGLLLALSRALYSERVQIVSSAVRTHEGRVLDRFEITEYDGSAISPERRLEIQVAVMSAIGSVG